MRVTSEINRIQPKPAMIKPYFNSERRGLGEDTIDESDLYSMDYNKLKYHYIYTKI